MIKNGNHEIFFEHLGWQKVQKTSQTFFKKNRVFLRGYERNYQAA